MKQLPNEVREQLNFQVSLLRLNGRLEAAISPTVTSDENVAVEVEKLAGGGQ